eukprot:COSAG01_NODE_272_length_19747_cov_298.524023_18_plen_156_part_00
MHGECSLLKMKPDAVFFLGDGTGRHAFDTRRCAAAGLHSGRVCAQVAGILEASSRPQVSQSARPLTLCGASCVAPHAIKIWVVGAAAFSPMWLSVCPDSEYLAMGLGRGLPTGEAASQGVTIHSIAFYTTGGGAARDRTVDRGELPRDPQHGGLE